MPAGFSIISAPSPLGLWPSGVQALGSALLDHGLDERLGAPVVGTFHPGTYVREKDFGTGYLNGPKVRAMALDVAGLVAAERAAGRVPLVLGGDCSVQLGGLLALRREGRFGLLHLDGHADFYDGTADGHSGEVADMGLAIATGRRHPSLSDIDGLTPYIRPGDAVAYGFRDEDEARADGSPSVRDQGIHLWDLPRLRREGTDRGVAGALCILADPGLKGAWVHFDADAIDNALNPAVDYPLAGGLHWEEASAVIRALREAGRVAGMSVSIFNPRKDPDGRIAMALTDCLVGALRG